MQSRRARLFAFTLLLFPAVPSWAAHAPEAAKSTPLAQQSSTASPKTPSSRNRAPAGRKVKHRRSARKAGPSYQLHPDAQRYQEIQKALADRGYFKGDVNGQWGDDSIDALKRFQADQKLPDDGKINSLSLIGLGLGPKHNGSTVTPANGTATPAVQPPPPPEQAAPPASEDTPH